MVILVGLVVTIMVIVAGERRATASMNESVRVVQLASSAPEMVISQVQNAAESGLAWASQPGLISTYSDFGVAGPVYKLFSSDQMVVDGGGYAITQDAPPENWNAGWNTAIWSDINRPVELANDVLAYPVVDPEFAADAFDASAQIVGFARQSNATPGYAPGAPAGPTNNPLPMPVRWLYVLDDGGLAIPESVGASGVVTFASHGKQPSASNPIVGRLAFWTDDESSKININTAGYSRNDDLYWTYWDTPVLFTRDESFRLSYAQPWTNEFHRYPGHPATTGLNGIFDTLNLEEPVVLGDEAVLSLTPRFRSGGSRGGTVVRTTAPSTAEVEALGSKRDRLFASVDEVFFRPDRVANSAAVAKREIEARRFLLTANSRSPETTLFNTPRVTLWPIWNTAGKRNARDQLIAFTSTIANQPFYFVREDPLSSNELMGIPQNLAVWNYLHDLSARPIPGFGNSFEAKYGHSVRNQILTSMFDAIRLTNLDDRSGASAQTNTAWSFTAGPMQRVGDQWAPPSNANFTAGYVSPTEGPSGTRAAGRIAALAEVALLLARPSNSTAESDGIREVDRVKAAMLYGFFIPSAGFGSPGQRRRVVVTGLSDLGVRLRGSTDAYQTLFTEDRFETEEVDEKDVSLRFGGGRLDWSVSRKVGGGYGVPPTGEVVLPFNASDPDANQIDFSGGLVRVEVFSPENAPSPVLVYEINFPQTFALTPLPVTNTQYRWEPDARWSSAGQGSDGRALSRGLYEQRISALGDTVLAMQSSTGDYRTEVLRTGVVSDFQPHRRYGQTDILGLPGISTLQNRQLSRRASSLKWEWNVMRDLGAQESINDVLFGRLIDGFNAYNPLLAPAVPTGPPSTSTSTQAIFPPGDFSNGPGLVGDGALSPKSDEGAAYSGPGSTAGQSPYFRNVGVENMIAEGTLASANRQIASAIYFGSIPSGAPWRTLLFRPARPFHSGGTSHFGATSPPDYLMLDWFHMPVVEPYAISEPLSTAGKVNLNTEIVPFANYLRRESALAAVLESARVIGLPESAVAERDVAAAVMAGGIVTAQDAPDFKTRFPLNIEEMLSLIRQRAEGTDGTGMRVYLAAAEICGIDLVPEAFRADNLGAFWSDKRITGDNSREAPYSALLPRLTTRSNTFTVHVTAETLATARADGGWDERQGAVTARWRGSFSFERYVDPNDSRFDPTSPTYAGAAATDFLSGGASVEPFYRYRFLGERRFGP